MEQMNLFDGVDFSPRVLKCPRCNLVGEQKETILLWVCPGNHMFFDRKNWRKCLEEIEVWPGDENK